MEKEPAQLLAVAFGVMLLIAGFVYNLGFKVGYNRGFSDTYDLNGDGVVDTVDLSILAAKIPSDD